MTTRISRRSFVKRTVAAGAAVAAAPVVARAAAPPSEPAPAGPRAPTALVASTVKPVVISSENGNVFKNGGKRTCVEEAFVRITSGADVLDALIAGVNIVELDPEEEGVGYGGLPNAEGVVQLDSCCMHGPRKRAGGVACIEGVRTPSKVAQTVMNETDHHLLVGRDAQRFARQMGFKIEDDLNTDKSRRLWLEWKRRIDPSHYLDPAKRADEAERVRREMIADGLIRKDHVYGTINCNGLNAKGDICGVTTTSGLAWKIPGRVGDSPILGAGLHVDGEVGAAGSTGRGEANLYNLSSAMIVDEMRRGAHPKDAIVEALRRIQRNTIERRLLNSKGWPDFDVTFYVLDRKGRYASGCFYAGRKFALCTDKGPQSPPCDALLGERPKA